MKLLWTGSDVLFATRIIVGRKFPTKPIKYIYFLGCTIFAKIADKFVDEHVVVSYHLIKELGPLKLKKKNEVRENPVNYEKMDKLPHKGFNLLYYRGIGKNQIFFDWVYGYDIFLQIKQYFGTGINFIEVNGDQNMAEVYPLIDFYLRPNRHDGNPRMVRECEINNIPYYHSYENPNFIKIVNEIKKQIQSKSI